MKRELMDAVERKCLKPKAPEFRIGDTVDVHSRIREGGKERVQVFNGVVISRTGRGINANFTVRRIVNNEGVERIFMLHSPLVADVQVKRSGKVRRAKLYFLRHRVGKARRLREVRVSRDKHEQASSRAAAESAAGRHAEPVGTSA